MENASLLFCSSPWAPLWWNAMDRPSMNNQSPFRRFCQSFWVRLTIRFFHSFIRRNFIFLYDLPSSFHQCNSTIDPTCSSCFLSSKCFAIDTNRLTRLCVATIAQSYRYMYATAYYYNGTSLLDEIIEANSNNHKLVIPTRCCDLICF